MLGSPTLPQPGRIFGRSDLPSDGDHPLAPGGGSLYELGILASVLNVENGLGFSTSTPDKCFHSPIHIFSMTYLQNPDFWRGFRYSVNDPVVTDTDSQIFPLSRQFQASRRVGICGQVSKSLSDTLDGRRGPTCQVFLGSSFDNKPIHRDSVPS